MRDAFSYYPWNLNTNLVRKYRNAQLWQAMQSIQIMQLLFRIPYLITADEATAFFRAPIDNKKIVGIKSREIIQKIQNLDVRVINQNNVQIGRLIGDDEHEVEIGCPPKSLTKHALLAKRHFPYISFFKCPAKKFHFSLSNRPKPNIVQ